MSNFQFNSKSVFLTFSQCDYPLKDFRDNIEKYFGTNLEKGVVSREKHKDGNWHLHAAICLARPHRSREVGLFDTLVDPPHHPNIQGRFTGGMLKAFDYVMKEGNFLPLNEKSFDLKEFLKLSKEKKNSSGSDRKRIRRSTGGRCDGEQQGLHAAPRQASPRLRSLAARARATLEVCQGPSSKGICRACARLLQRMEQRDCFLADDESSTEEEAPAEAALDPGPGDREDHLSDDVGGDLFPQHLPVA